MAYKRIMATPSGLILNTCGLLSVMAVLLIQDVIRPKHLRLNATGMFLQGTLPNFFAATCLAPFIFLLMVTVAGVGAQLNKLNFYACVFTFFGLTLWELILHYYGHRNIDVYDILMSAIGGVMMFFFIKAIAKAC